MQLKADPEAREMDRTQRVWRVTEGNSVFITDTLKVLSKGRAASYIGLQ